MHDRETNVRFVTLQIGTTATPPHSVLFDDFTQRCSATMSALLNMPNEILSAIAGLLTPARDPELYLAGHRDDSHNNQAVAAFSLTCRRIRHIALPFLFRHIYTSSVMLWEEQVLDEGMHPGKPVADDDCYLNSSLTGLAR